MSSRMCRRALAILTAPLAVLTVFTAFASTSAAAPTAGPPNVLILSDSEFRSDVQAKLQGTGLFGTVAVDTGSVAPTLSTLQSYSGVLLFTSAGAMPNSVALGNVLADYVDTGGRVVVAPFYLSHIDGDLASEYLPFSAPTGSISGGPYELVPDAPDNPLLASVASFNGGTSSFRTAATLTEGAQLIAHWNDAASTPLVAVKTAPSGGAVVGLNFFPPSSDARVDLWVASTDGARLMANALLPFGPPANDRLANAAPITTFPYNDSAITVQATFTRDEPKDCMTGKSIWYKFTPTNDMGVEADTLGSGFDTRLALYSGLPATKSKALICNDEYNGVQSRLLANLKGGTTYYFMVGGYSTATGYAGTTEFHFDGDKAVPSTAVSFAGTVDSAGQVSLDVSLTCGVGTDAMVTSVTLYSRNNRANATQSTSLTCSNTVTLTLSSRTGTPFRAGTYYVDYAGTASTSDYSNEPLGGSTTVSLARP